MEPIALSPSNPPPSWVKDSRHLSLRVCGLTATNPTRSRDTVAWQRSITNGAMVLYPSQPPPASSSRSSRRTTHSLSSLSLLRSKGNMAYMDVGRQYLITHALSSRSCSPQIGVLTWKIPLTRIVMVSPWQTMRYQRVWDAGMGVGIS